MNLLHFFIPSPRNNFRARLLHIDMLTGLVLLSIVFSYSISSLNATPIGKVLGIATDITIEKVSEFANQKRAENGAPALALNSQLSSAACEKAKYMFANNLWAHYGPDGTTPWSFILSAGYRYQYAGENLAKDFLVSQDVVNAWMNSLTHRENLLKKEYKDVGYCAVNGILNGQETTIVVQIFGTPQGSAIVPQAKAETGERAGAKVAAAAKPSTKPTLEPSKKVLESTPPAEIVVGSNQIQKSSPSFSLASFSINLTFILFALLAFALAFDFYFAYKLRLTRLVGKHLAHFIFLGFAIISVIVITKGTIL